MKIYGQLVEVLQFAGNIEELENFAGKENVDLKDEEILVNENITLPEGKWKVKFGDYVVKTRIGFDVYKEASFEKYFPKITNLDVIENYEKNFPEEINQEMDKKEDLKTDEETSEEEPAMPIKSPINKRK